MKFEKRMAKHFKKPYYTYGEWRLDAYSTFPHEDYLSADTETKLYLDGKQISDSELYSITSKLKKPNKYIKEHIEVRAYAYMLSNGKDFALFQDIEDFITACAMFNVTRVFLYNVRFDYAIFDYYLLTNGWNDIMTLLEEDS